MYARMVIGQASDRDHVTEFTGIYQTEVLPKLSDEPGFRSANLMIEEGGKMAISLTIWDSRQACLEYHSGLAYRQFVERTHHLLDGDFVVRLFRSI